MKNALAILFSLLLVWAQVASAGPAQTSSVTGAVCQCCACGGTGCCVSESSSSDSTPLPATPVRAGFEQSVSVLAATFVGWTLPQSPADAIASVAAGSLLSGDVPLFTRHCALLI